MNITNSAGVPIVEKRPKGRPKGEGKGRTQPVAVQIRSSEEWRDYIKAFAKDRGVDVAELIEEAIRMHAVYLRRELPPKR